jgi:hypothetical protein
MIIRKENLNVKSEIRIINGRVLFLFLLLGQIYLFSL